MIKDRKGISPINVAILLVAITVLLAAGLYMVIVPMEDEEEPTYTCPHCGHVYDEDELIDVSYYGGHTYYCPYCNSQGIQVIVHTR